MTTDIHRTIAADLEWAIMGLADIAGMAQGMGSIKAKRMYDLLRSKYPIDVREVFETSDNSGGRI